MSKVRSCVVDGVELAYASRTGDGPCVVFIAGLGMPGATWDGVIERLPAESAVFTYDRAGCGASGALPAQLAAGERPIRWGAEQLKKLLEMAGAQGPWVLVGHSIGGLIADAFARRWPESVAGMVLIDASDPTFQSALDVPRPVSVDGREGEGWRIDGPGTLADFESGADQLVETVVIGSAMWRWLELEETAPYRPLTRVELDQRWQRHQLSLAERWDGHLVIPHTAGHGVHKDAPDLVAVTTRAVVEAATAKRSVQLSQEALVRSGGTVRVSVKDGRFTVWDAAGPMPGSIGLNDD